MCRSQCRRHDSQASMGARRAVGLEMMEVIIAYDDPDKDILILHDVSRICIQSMTAAAFFTLPCPMSSAQCPTPPLPLPIPLYRHPACSRLSCRLYL